MARRGLGGGSSNATPQHGTRWVGASQAGPSLSLPTPPAQVAAGRVGVKPAAARGGGPGSGPQPPEEPLSAPFPVVPCSVSPGPSSLTWAAGGVCVVVFLLSAEPPFPPSRARRKQDSRRQEAAEAAVRSMALHGLAVGPDSHNTGLSLRFRYDLAEGKVLFHQAHHPRRRIDLASDRLTCRPQCQCPPPCWAVCPCSLLTDPLFSHLAVCIAFRVFRP